MAATKHDILDLVAVTVGDIRSGGWDGKRKAKDVVLDGDNILIGANSIPIADIEATAHSIKGFLKLIRGAM